MMIKEFDRLKKEQILCENLQRIEENRKNGQKGYTPEEVHAILGQVMKETVRYRIMDLKQFECSGRMDNHGCFWR